MPSRHVVVDGSNLATEGRTTPSLAQLEEVVAEIRRELDAGEVTVVVDASFAHRIDPSELARFEELAGRGELVSPPAGAVGRGDAFLLRIAEKVKGTVVSNDSFQEFHGEHPWLFERGRLIGASRVPGVGWIFVDRNPVRGPRSRVAVRENQRAKKQVERAIATATKEAVKPAPPQKTPKKATKARLPASPQAVNDPMTFISFVAEHPLGAEIEAEVESFTSHGAVVRSGDLAAYVPLSGLGDPPPRSARGVLKKGEKRRFAITALDPYRRAVEVALPGAGVVSGRPSEETVAAVVKLAKGRSRRPPIPAAEKAKTKARPAKKTLKVVAAKAPAAKARVAKSPAAKARAAKSPAAKAQATKTLAAKAQATKTPAAATSGPRRSPRSAIKVAAVVKKASTSRGSRGGAKRRGTKSPG